MVHSVFSTWFRSGFSRVRFYLVPWIDFGVILQYIYEKEE